MCAVGEYVRIVCVTVVVCVWCRGLPLLLWLGEREGAESLSWMSLVMSCTAWTMREPSLSFSFRLSRSLAPFLSSPPSFVSAIFSFLQAAGFGGESSRRPQTGASATGVWNGVGSQVGASGSLVLLAVWSSWFVPHTALGGLSEGKRPGGSGGAVGSQKLSLCAIRAITSCLSCSSEPINGLVSLGGGRGEVQRGGSAKEKFFKALRGSRIGPFDLSPLLVPDP